MKKLVFATNNLHKITEISNLLGSSFELVTLQQAGINIDIPEPHDTLEANAREKAVVIYDLTGLNCFSEDTGLEVAALGGAPGVNSAHYAGEARSPEHNIARLLSELDGLHDRSAQFRTVIYLIDEGKHTTFEGICKGIILANTKGEKGFGYDPVFVPEGSDKTFAEMTLDEKQKYSHRAKAFSKLIIHLNTY